jgi:hypothetical protein
VYYKNPDILKAMDMAVGYSEKIQRPDGTFDLLISNFYSAPDTGFIMHNLARAYKVMDKYAVTQGEIKLKKRLFELIRKAAKGLCEGGFHTPNHRWVEAAGLLLAYNITKEEYLKDMALRYLAEGIDIDENGEFTERSPGIYNYVNDNALMIIAEELGKPQYYNHAAHNLDMMLAYIEPDGSIFTQNSVRVDKGEGDTSKGFYPAHYYSLYLEMAYRFNNHKFAEFAKRIHEGITRNGSGAQGILWLFMLEEGLKSFETDKGSVADEFEVFYEPSNIVRRRKDKFSVTILGGGSPNFLFVQKGRMRCYVRMCASFFAVAQFKPDKILKTDKGYRLTFNAHGSYRMPFDVPPKTSVWHEMDHGSRKTVNHLDLKYTADIIMKDDGVELKVKTAGCDRVPVKLEFCLTGGCRIQGDDFVIKGTPGESIILGRGHAKASLDGDSITIGPGFKTHTYSYDMRGSVPPSGSDYTVYFTEYTNIDRTVSIRVE